MRRAIVISLFALLALLAVGAGLGWYLLHDEEFLKARLSDYVREATGRELRVRALRIDPGRVTSVEASGISLANPEWADTPEMVRLGHVRLSIDIPSLFDPTTVIPSLHVDGCRVELLENAAGQSNWADLAGPDERDEPAPEDPQELPARLLDGRIADCEIVHRAPGRESPLTLAIEFFELRLIGGHRWQSAASATVNGDALNLSGWMEPAGALLYGKPAELELALRVGEVQLNGKGHFENLSTGAGADLTVDFRGPELARVLAHLNLPPISDGPFDLRLALDSQGPTSKLQLRGDLGAMQADADGELDRLVNPSRGSVRASVQGPDLEAMGRAFGLDGLPDEPYSLRTAVNFEPGNIRFDSLDLKTAADRLVASGTVGTGRGLAHSDLSLTAHSTEIGHWAGLWGQPPDAIGAFTLEGGLSSDASGLFAYTGTIELDAARLALTGPVGFVSGDLQGDLKFDLNAERPQPLAALAGRPDFPDLPLSARGRLGLTAQRIRLDEVKLSLGSHRAQLEGAVNPAAPFTGSEVALRLDSPDLASLGRLFGQEALPAAPVTLSGRFSRPDQRLRLQDVVLEVDSHGLRVDGYLLPGERHWTVDSMNARLTSPDLSALGGLVGAGNLPPEPIDLGVKLQREGEGVRFEAKQADTGSLRLQASGEIPDLDKPLLMNAAFDAKLPSLSLIAFLQPGMTWPELPASAEGTLRMEQDRVILEGIEAELGSMRATLSGDLRSDRSFGLDAAVQGPDASELQAWLDARLPPDDFSVQLRLAGEPGALTFSDVQAQLGDNRATAQLRAAFGGRNRLNGTVRAPRIDLTYWLQDAPEGAPGDKNAQKDPAAFLFDDTPIDRLVDFGWDLDLGAELAEVVIGNGLFKDIQVTVRLSEQRFEVSHFAVTGRAGGQGSGHFVLDSATGTPRLSVGVFGENVRSGLFSPPGQDPATMPPIDLQLELQGTGHTRREMVSSLDGHWRLFAGAGAVTSSGLDLIFNDFLTELFQLLNPFAEKSRLTQLECAVAGARFEAGQVTVNPVVVNTDELTIFSQGSVDLRSEKLDLSFNSKPRKGLGLTPGLVINPLIKVGGTLASPAIEFDKSGAIVTGGTAVATAGLSLLAKGFADRFLSSRDPCGEAREAIATGDES